MDEHALGVDIRGFEGAGLRDPQTGSIGGGENSLVFGDRMAAKRARTSAS